MAKKVDFEKQLTEGSAVLGLLESALGVKGKSATLALIKSDPEARRIAEKIVGTGSPADLKAALDPAAAASGAASSKPAKVEF